MTNENPLYDLYSKFNRKYEQFVEACKYEDDNQVYILLRKELNDIGEQYINQFKEEKLSFAVTLSEGKKTIIDIRAVAANKIISILEELQHPRSTFFQRLGIDAERAESLKAQLSSSD